MLDSISIFDIERVISPRMSERGAFVDVDELTRFLSLAAQF